MIIVELKEGETLDRGLRRFKKKFERLGILKQVRRRMYNTPPSVAKRDETKKIKRKARYMAKMAAQA